MNFNTLLYYKNIYDMCGAYDKKMGEMDYSSTNEAVRNSIADKTLYLFCQATETYCMLLHNFNESGLSDETKREIQDGLDLFKAKCLYLLDRMEELHASMPNKFDPTQEFIQVGKYLYRDDKSVNLREMLQKEEEQHQKTMTNVREYKNAVVNGVLMSQYKMVDVADATHKLARSGILINHCLAPAAMISGDDALKRMGEAVKRKIEDRENAREVKTSLTPQGMMCSLYSHDLTLEDQKRVMGGKTVESVLSQKNNPASKEEYPHIFSLLTTDHTGLVYTQNIDKFGAMQIGKWLNKDDLKIAHLVTFKSQNQWDGSKRIKDNSFVNAIKSTTDWWKNTKKEIQVNRERYFARHAQPKVDKAIEKMIKVSSMSDQDVAEKVARIVTNPQAVKFTLRAENQWAIIQSSTDIDYLANINPDNYMKALRSRLRRNAAVSTVGRYLDDEQWDAAKKFASKAISTAAKTLDFIQKAIQGRTIGPGNALQMASIIIENVVPFDDFTSCSIDESLKRTLSYSDKLLKMAVANEKWLETHDPKYKDEMRKIGNSFTKSEAKRFVESVRLINEMDLNVADRDVGDTDRDRN